MAQLAGFPSILAIGIALAGRIHVPVLAGVKETAIAAFFVGIFWDVSQVISEQVGWLLTTLLVKLGIVSFVLVYSLLAGRELGVAAMSTTTRVAVVLMGIIEAGAYRSSTMTFTPT